MSSDWNVKQFFVTEQLRSVIRVNEFPTEKPRKKIGGKAPWAGVNKSRKLPSESQQVGQGVGTSTAESGEFDCKLLSELAENLKAQLTTEQVIKLVDLLTLKLLADSLE